jgi:hypothetical protein
VQFPLKGRIYGWLICESGAAAEGGDLSATPTLPTALAADALAADLIQRPVPARVSTKRRLRAAKLIEPDEWGRRRASRYPRRPCRPLCFGDGGCARSTYFNEQMPARFLMAIPKARLKHFYWDDIPTAAGLRWICWSVKLRWRRRRR